MNLYDYKGIVIDKGWKGTKEGIAVHTTCLLNKIPVRFSWNSDPLYDGIGNEDYVKPYEIPVGDIPFSCRWIQKSEYKYEKERFKPDFYPKTLSKYITRNIWKTTENPIKKCFVKSTEYKNFESFIFEPPFQYTILNPPFKIICSDIVNFVDEWRYYITNGKVVFASWYKGQSELSDDLPQAPTIEVPEGFYGTIDMGLTDTGKLELVECHHPFACGWYGRLVPEEMEIYTQWLIDGRKHLDCLKGHND